MPGSSSPAGGPDAGSSTWPATARRGWRPPASRRSMCSACRYRGRRGALFQPSPPHAGGRRPDRAPDLHHCADRRCAGCLLLCLLLLALTACGDYPARSLGNPGATRACGSRQPPRCRAWRAGTRRTAAAVRQRQPCARRGDRRRACSRRSRPSPTRRAATDWRLAITAQDRGSADRSDLHRAQPAGTVAGHVPRRARSPSPPGPAADPATLKQAAIDAAPGIARPADQDRGRPDAEPIRTACTTAPPSVAVPDVTGAPGDGDTIADARRCAAKLAALGPQVRAGHRMPAPTSPCRARCGWSPSPAASNGVEIQWIITDAKGARTAAGSCSSTTSPAGTLDHYWGDVAMVVAQEAAGGVNDVIRGPVRREQRRARSGRQRQTHRTPAAKAE